MRKKKFVLNTIASFLTELAAIVSGFVIPRAILGAFGSDVNGLLTSIDQFLRVITVGEMGLGVVIRANLYRPLAEQDTCAISAIVKSSEKFFRRLALVLVLYVCILIAVYSRLVSNTFGFGFSASLIIICSLTAFTQYYFGITNQYLLDAAQQAYISMFLSAGALFLMAIVNVYMLDRGMPIQLVKLASVGLFMVRPLVLYFYVKKHYKIDRTIKLETEPIKQKWNGLVQHITAIVQDNTDTIILTIFSTLKNVSVYAVYALVINGMIRLIYMANAGLTSLMGDMIARGEKEKLKSVFNIAEWLMHTSTVLVFSVTGFMVLPFVNLYTAGIHDVNYLVPTFAILITVCGVFRGIQSCYNMVIQAAGHFKETQTAAVFEPIINIVLSIALVRRFGLPGVAVGTIISLAYRMCYLVLYLSKHILHLKIRSFLKQVAVDVLSALLIVFVCRYIPIKAANYFEWAVSAVVVGCAALFLTLGVNLVVYRDNMKAFYRRILKRA